MFTFLCTLSRVLNTCIVITKAFNLVSLSYRQRLDEELTRQRTKQEQMQENIGKELATLRTELSGERKTVKNIDAQVRNY